ncbi:MAG TPA: hypothetical protein P5081_21250 [Phycisphaerae bacterium]|nr:hypothetical protein [Phycisphaerae bacterium]HRW55410.1 hypothetical protein [Phycisphaerae bacterium]
MKTNTTNKSSGNTLALTMALLGIFGFTAASFAGESTSSASAGAGHNGPGTATASAGYSGNGAGIVRTNTRSGNNFSIGRGVSVGIDEDGLTLSASHAVATRNGPAIASNFNLSIGRDGSVSSSRGVSVATGGESRTAFAGGGSATTRSANVATSTAGGSTIRGGRVHATTRSDTTRRTIAPRRVYRIRR